MEFLNKIKFIIAASLIKITFIQSILSQTSGTLSYTVTTTSSGGYSPLHVVVIWIEDNIGNFIKTKLKDCSNTTIDHLDLWTSKSGGNVVDALTGPTLTSHGTLSIEWNGKNVSGTLVPDGVYKVWIEMAWADSKTTGKTSTSFSFTKGPALDYVTPSNTANFSSISLKWIPAALTSIKSDLQSESIKVYPNPANDIITIAFNHPTAKCRIRILNVAGTEIYEDKSEAINIEGKTIYLSNFADGIYFITIQTDNKTSLFRIIKNK